MFTSIRPTSKVPSLCSVHTGILTQPSSQFFECTAFFEQVVLESSCWTKLFIRMGQHKLGLFTTRENQPNNIICMLRGIHKKSMFVDPIAVLVQ